MAKQSSDQQRLIQINLIQQTSSGMKQSHVLLEDHNWKSSEGYSYSTSEMLTSLFIRTGPQNVADAVCNEQPRS